MIIEAQNLTKYYGKTVGIKGLNLEVEEKDIFGFIGPNGSGKSTTIRILMGLMSSSSGSAKIFGKDIRKYKEEILSNIGYIPSEVMFYKGMKVSEVLSLSEKLYKKISTAKTSDLCERFQLDPSKKVEKLSLGNRKKVSIICALQHNPKLYIFDEPTSGLDPLIQNEFFKILKERVSEGATVFLSSHILSEIQMHCNKAGIIREGTVIACDSVEKLSKTKAKRVNITGINNIEMKGIVDVKTDKNNISFLYNGDMSYLLLKLQGLKIKDLTITEPSLDEIFMHFYSKDGENNDYI
ncbi:ABC transporter ATP-binding protein [Miniphocaeibacter massiliensis]|uniref:ABC transporter ATP-binding protein n=1 Tax=Miniphocaeibacter massiliensis TaxID=2041841 RepID=UPI000C1C692B|nr:ABC transporter ATP-binding protein [Miniphocaeibacter massiliensis]